MAAGIEYPSGQLVAMDSGRLHTRMFVYPDGLERSDELPAWLYTTATSRVDDGLELLAMYSETLAAGYLGLYSWTCLPDYPCPNGDTARDWQWSRALTELSCNISQVVDQGGHAQKQLYYANHSDRLDNGTPPLWRSAAYLWNYCDAAWDLAWEHIYRGEKLDCSIPGARLSARAVPGFFCSRTIGLAVEQRSCSAAGSRKHKSRTTAMSLAITARG
jgi:hypothetical protein